MPEPVVPGELVDAAAARQAMFEAARPLVDLYRSSVPAGHRIIVVIQPHPLLARILAAPLPHGAVVEVDRFEPHAEEWAGQERARVIAESVDRFVAAGLSALPPDAAAGALSGAGARGGGFCVLLDMFTGSARCLLALPGKPLGQGLELFAIVPEPETSH